MMQDKSYIRVLKELTRDLNDEEMKKLSSIIAKKVIIELNKSN